MKSANAAIVFAVALLLAGCSESPLESLVGCFSMNTKDKPNLKVTEADDSYAVSMHENGNWGEAKPMRLGDAQILQQVMGDDADKAQASLVSEDGPVVLIRVDPEATIAGGKAESGYLGSFFFGTGQVYRAESCDQD